MGTIVVPQLLIIAGTGQNTGKTTLACDIIRKFNHVKSIISLKITPHFHKNIQSGKVLIDNANLYIAEETDSTIGKDSSMMLGAGAKRSFLVVAKDENLGEAFRELTKLIPSDASLVCESGGLRHHVIPGLFLMMKNTDNISLKPGTVNLMHLADRVITYNREKIDFDLDKIDITDNQWTLKQ